MTGVATVWWLGFWRAGEHLYWWTTVVSPEADRDTLRATVRERVRPQVWQATVDPAVAGPAEAAVVAAGHRRSTRFAWLAMSNGRAQLLLRW